MADLDSEAPKTAMVETRARPTMRAEEVWAVRRGLRMEFSRPSRPGDPEQAGQRAAEDAGHRPGHQRGEHADAEEDGHGAEPDQLDGRLG